MKTKSPQARFPCLIPVTILLVASLATGSPLETLTSQTGTPAGPYPYTGDPVSLKLLNASLIDFFRVISELSGLNVIIDPEVKGTITINAAKVPWDQLFQVVLKSHRLEKSVEGNVVRISTREKIRQEDEATQALSRAAFLAEKTETVSRRLNYADAEVVFKTLNKEKAFLSERGELMVDKRTNTLFVTDVSEKIQRFMSMLDTIDVPERQVVIEARIIEATTNFARRIGVELGILLGGADTRTQGFFGVAAPVGNPIGAAGLISGKLTDTFRLDALITAAELKGEARMLSKPRVSAQNNAPAVITQGSRFPIPVQINFSTNVRFETAALRLTVTPHITEEQTIALQLKLENNVPDFNRTVLGIPTILTSEAETRVLVEDGGTTVIGGIFVEVDREFQDGVPGLAGVPVLGHLFKKTSVEKETREILFFLTPKIKR